MKKFEQLPKSPIIKNSIEIQNYLKSHYKIEEAWNNYPSPDTHPYLMVAISNSNSGYLYYRQAFYTEKEYFKYWKNNHYVKDFTSVQAFYDYLNQCLTIKKIKY